MKTLILILLFSASCGSIAAADQPISFSAQIAPILQAKCVGCHGPKTAESDYRLDTFARLMRAASETPIVAADLGKSELYQRLITDDEDSRMPADADPLASAEIEMIRHWIEQGARFDGDSPGMPLAGLSPAVVHPAPPEHYRAALPISAVAVGDSGKEIYVSGYREITVWTIDGRLKRRIQNQGERTYSIELHPTKPLMLTASGTPGVMGEVRLFNIASGELQSVVVRSDEAIMDARFNVDGSKIAVAMPNGSTQILAGRPLELETVLLGHSDQVMKVAWHPDGKRLATASRDKTAKIFDTEAGKSVSTFTGHHGSVNAIALINNDHVISASDDGTLLLWSIADGRKQRDIISEKQPLLSIATGPQHYAIGGVAGTRRIEKGSHRQLDHFTSDGNWVTAVTIDLAGNRIITGTQIGEIVIWQAGKQTARFTAMP